jgi:hypothetical protein
MARFSIRSLIPGSMLWAALSLTSACAPPQIQSAPGNGRGGGDGGTSGGGGSGGAASGADAGRTDGNAPGAIPVGGAGGQTVPPESKCAAKTFVGERLPVDLLLLVDSSGSMGYKPGAAATKWQMQTEALGKFLKDPMSAGLGVGLQFFPLPTAGKACTGDIDCRMGLSIGGSCVPRSYCAGAQSSQRTCSDAGLRTGCEVGETCVPTGRCSMSGADCTNIGQPCPGMANDRCTDPPRICIFGSTTCVDDTYRNVAVPIADLPGNEPVLSGWIAEVLPGGGTPLGPALRGAYAHLRAHLATNAGRRAAVVVATDGVPQACSPLSTDGLAQLVAGARMGNPSIATYVIGVFTPTEATGARPLLEGLATAGGSGMPFLLDPSQDLTQKFQDALGQIRGAALACEYMLPPAQTGNLDYDKVTVRFKGSMGDEEVPRVMSAAACDPVRGGWYYDVDPARATPTRIVACPATCRHFQGDQNGRVELVVGCQAIK